MIMKLFWCQFILTTIIVNSIAYGQDCYIDFKNDLASKTPVFIKNGKLQSPIRQYFTWSSGEESKLVCSGVKNSFKKTTTKEIKLKCHLNNILTVNGQQVSLDKLKCNSISTADVRPTSKRCLSKGIIQEIGFNTQSSGFVKYIEVCYNMNNAAVAYTRHIIPGKAIDYIISESIRPTFSTKGMPKHAQPNKSYRQDVQLARFTSLLGSTSAKIYLNSNSFLARGHLSPDKDGIFRSWQYSTYMYINVAPQWQAVNAQNWKRVEYLARKKAALLNDDLEIVTGTSGLLSLKNDRGQYVPIALEPNNNISVPRYFWKILKYENAAIAFITLNNPFEYSAPFCNSICNQNNWPSTEFDNVSKGLTFCCSTIELKRVFPHDVPRDVITTNILSY